jgi:hypothetical protein
VGLDPEAATVATLDTAGRSVLVAGGTVMVSMLGLFADMIESRRNDRQPSMSSPLVTCRWRVREASGHALHRERSLCTKCTFGRAPSDHHSASPVRRHACRRSCLSTEGDCARVWGVPALRGDLSPPKGRQKNTNRRATAHRAPTRARRPANAGGTGGARSGENRRGPKTRRTRRCCASERGSHTSTGELDAYSDATQASAAHLDAATPATPGQARASQAGAATGCSGRSRCPS